MWHAAWPLQICFCPWIAPHMWQEHAVSDPSLLRSHKEITSDVLEMTSKSSCRRHLASWAHAHMLRIVFRRTLKSLTHGTPLAPLRAVMHCFTDSQPHQEKHFFSQGHPGNSHLLKVDQVLTHQCQYLLVPFLGILFLSALSE